MKKEIKRFEKKILFNIRRDRQTAEDFLMKINDYLISMSPEEINGEHFSKIMLAAAKLVENSQKSNEQILRVFESYTKKKEVESGPNLSKQEIENLYKEEQEVEI